MLIKIYYIKIVLAAISLIMTNSKILLKYIYILVKKYRDATQRFFKRSLILVGTTIAQAHLI